MAKYTLKNIFKGLGIEHPIRNTLIGLGLYAVCLGVYVGCGGLKTEDIETQMNVPVASASLDVVVKQASKPISELDIPEPEVTIPKISKPANTPFRIVSYESFDSYLTPLSIIPAWIPNQPEIPYDDYFNLRDPQYGKPKVKINPKPEESYDVKELEKSVPKINPKPKKDKSRKPKRAPYQSPFRRNSIEWSA